MARKGLRPKQGGRELKEAFGRAGTGAGVLPWPAAWSPPPPHPRRWSCCSGLRLPSHEQAPHLPLMLVPGPCPGSLLWSRFQTWWGEVHGVG